MCDKFQGFQHSLKYYLAATKMLKEKTCFFPALFILTTLACNTTLLQSESIPTVTPSRVVPTIEPTQASLPQTEADVSRVSAADAKAELDSGQAIIVDVRGAQFFAQKHIADAVNIPLANIENNPAGVYLDKNKWIITYCT